MSKNGCWRATVRSTLVLSSGGAGGAGGRAPAGGWRSMIGSSSPMNISSVIPSPGPGLALDHLGDDLLFLQDQIVPFSERDRRGAHDVGFRHQDDIPRAHVHAVLAAVDHGELAAFLRDR